MSTAASGAGRLSSATRDAASSDVMWMVATPDSTSPMPASVSAASRFAAAGRAGFWRLRRAFAIGLVLQVLVGALLGAVAGVVGARVPAHRANAVVHRAADAVVRERAEGDAGAAVEAFGGLDQALRPYATRSSTSIAPPSVRFTLRAIASTSDRCFLTRSSLSDAATRRINHILRAAARPASRGAAESKGCRGRLPVA